jgi:hypothetical protein
VTLEPLVFSAVGITLTAGEFAGGAQADIVLDGLEQAGDSYELRIFVNDATADTDTELSPDAGYAGSIHVYGYGGMLPDEDEEQTGGVEPRMPMTRRRIATEVIRAAAAKASEMTVTLVPVAYGSSEPAVHLENVKVSVLVH